jgi:serine/threonine-protein kinase
LLDAPRNPRRSVTPQPSCAIHVLVGGAYFWCRFCGEPHRVGMTRCPKTRQPLETRVNRPIAQAPQAPGVERETGEVIDGRFELRKLLGEGASGKVYLAHDRTKGGSVAIKITKRLPHRAPATRLQQEALLAASITHPNVCRMFGSGKLPDGRPYLVMELLRGNTLSNLLRRTGRLDQTLAQGIAVQLLYGLHAAHQLGIVHRDVKPGNVFLVTRKETTPLVKLLDFGFAKAPPERALVKTRPGIAMGTPGYIAPEVLGAEVPDARSDLWAVGVILFEMLAGKRPFSSEPFSATQEETPLLSDYRPGVAPELVTIVEMALQKQPRLRFQSAAAFLLELEALSQDALSVTNPLLTNRGIPSIGSNPGDYDTSTTLTIRERMTLR